MPTTLATAADGQGKESGNNGRHRIVMDKLLLTPVEAAKTLGIGRSKLYELLAKGDVASVYIGACRRVPLDALRAYIAQLQDRSTRQS